MKSAEILFIGYILIGIVVFGNSTAYYVTDNSSTKQKVDAVFFGAFSGMAWPLYLSWRIQK